MFTLSKTLAQNRGKNKNTVCEMLTFKDFLITVLVSHAVSGLWTLFMSLVIYFYVLRDTPSATDPSELGPASFEFE